MPNKIINNTDNYLVVMNKRAEVLERIDISANNKEYIKSLKATKRKKYKGCKIFTV